MKKLKNSIDESTCSFELSKTLKAKGFDSDSISTREVYKSDGTNRFCHVTNEYIDQTPYFNGVCLKPTHAIAIEWVRVNCGVWVLLDILDVNNDLCNYVVKWHNGICLNEARGKGYETPQEATEAALLYVLNNLIK